MELVEAVHDARGDLTHWLDTLLEVLRRVVPSTVVASAAIVRRHPEHYELLAGDTAAHVGGPLAPMTAMLPTIDPTLLDRFYRIPRPLELHGIRSDGSAGRLVAGAFGDARAEDSLAFVAQCSNGVSMVAFALSGEPLVLTPREKLVLSRVAAHVEATLRVRVASQACAIVGSGGRVLAAEGNASERPVRERLSDYVLQIERGRAARRRAQPDALDAWTALLGGRYGVVEHADAGRREYHVLENPPHVWASRALDDREARVLELTARGLQGKLVAYHLGLSPAAVSTALRSAASKLGLGSRDELVALAADVLRPGGTPSTLSDLSPAERDILDRLALGWTNAAIAQARGTSERTVANQVHALLRKQKQPSRRALVAAARTRAAHGD